MNTRTNHGAIVTFNLTPELTAKAYEQYGFGPGITVVEKPKPFTLPALLPIQTLAQEQVELTSEMQEVVSQVLKEELQKPDPYAELKKAHAEGKVIQIMTNLGWQDFKAPAFAAEASAYRIKPDEIPWIKWHGGECPLKDGEVEEWEFKMRCGTLVPSHHTSHPTRCTWRHDEDGCDIISYRVLKWREPKPKQPLGPEDVKPFTVIRRKGEAQAWHWRTVSYVDAVKVTCGNRGYGWDELASDYERNESLPLTGKWNPDAWKPCEK